MVSSMVSDENAFGLIAAQRDERAAHAIRDRVAKGAGQFGGDGRPGREAQVEQAAAGEALQ